MKKLTKISAATLLGITALVGASHSTFAASGLPSTGESKASIQFLPGTGPVNPVDPEDPSTPLDPTDPNNPTDPGTGNDGALTLDYVSSIDFGSHEVSSNTEVYSSTSKKPFIQVTDRRGTGAGWTVTASASQFTNGSAQTLQGAVLTFKNAEEVSTTLYGAPTPETTVTLNADGTSSSKVVSAKVNTGLGTWVNRWFGATPNDTASLNNNVTLTVPAGSATVGSHEATITWTLTDAPGN